ncbi:hypothetical protein Acr_16g0004100 [Actinidia rufa]|uniref:Retrotransposon gag domain-containing protein n=1 Tax=Actinidia rufa TaxID=165716 RepID=A0A7J0FYN3_9ERIC|nr:hypothetical protein Acr_16g0004100 [Actinidia rufa]
MPKHIYTAHRIENKEIEDTCANKNVNAFSDLGVYGLIDAADGGDDRVVVKEIDLEETEARRRRDSAPSRTSKCFVFFSSSEKNDRVVVKEIDLEETERIDGGKEKYLALRGPNIARLPSYEVPSPHLERQTLSPNPLDRGKTSPWNLAKQSPLSSPEPPSEYSSDRPEPKYYLLLAIGRVPRRSSNIDCWLLAQISTTTVWRHLWERQFSMHLRSRNLPRPSASSPPGNRSPPMANPAQAPDLEGLHREIHDMAEQMRIMNENNGRLMQLLAAAAKPPLPAAPLVPEGGGDAKHQAPPCVKRVPPNLVKLRPDREGGGAPAEVTTPGARDKSTSQKIRDLDARLDAINTGTNAPVTVDALVRQTDPPFTKRVLGARISSKFKLPTQLGIYEGRTDPMDHLDSYKSLMSLQGCSDEVMCKAFSATLKGPARSWFRKLSPGTIDSFGELSRLFVANFMSCRNRQKNASHLFTVHQKETESLKDFVKRFNQAILEVEDPSDKVIIMAMMEGLRPGPLFDSLSKNVPETLSALQSKADKYIAAEELAEAKRRRRGKDDYKRKSLTLGGTTIEKKQDTKDLTEILNTRTIGVLAHHLAAPNLSYRHSTPLLPKYSQKLSTKNSSSGPERSRLIPRRGTGTNIVNSTGTTDTIPRTVFS